MTALLQHAARTPPARRLPANVIALGCVSLLMSMSSQMIHSLLPVFMLTVLSASAISVGIVEGVAEATNSFAKVFAGVFSDWLGRRKPLVLLGYGVAALSKPLFPLASDVPTVLLARFVDRTGKGIRDAPRDALLADQLDMHVRGAGFGLRLALFTIGSVIGPLVATIVMIGSSDMRLVFWVAVIPAFLSVAVLHLTVKEPPDSDGNHRHTISLRALLALAPLFWWIVAISGILELARFSQAFLLLKAKEVGVDVVLIPTFLMLMSAVYGLSAYPFGVLADRLNRRWQLAAGIVTLVACHVTLATAETVWMTAIGAILWGLQMGMIQGLIAASIADTAPAHLRGTAFGIYYLIDGVVSLLASTCAGVFWVHGGPAATFSVGAALSLGALLMLIASPRDQVHSRALERWT